MVEDEQIEGYKQSYLKNIWNHEYTKSGVSRCIYKESQARDQVVKEELTVIQYSSEEFSMNQKARDGIKTLNDFACAAPGRRLGH